MITCFTVPEIWRMTDVIIFHFGPFLPFYPHNGPKNENFKKMKKTLGDIIILHNPTKNHDRMLYCSWDMACDGCNCYFYVPFTPTNSPKNQNSKRSEKTLKISFYTCVPKIMIRWCTVPDGPTDRRKKWHIEVGAQPKNPTLLNGVVLCEDKY